MRAGTDTVAGRHGRRHRLALVGRHMRPHR